MNIDKEYNYVCDLIRSAGEYIETNWVVVTGAPSSGKSTVIEILHNNGYLTNPDISRKYLEEESAKGTSAADVRLNEGQLQKVLFILMVKNALSLNVDDEIFHDYSLPDNLPFLKLANIPIPREIIASSKMFRYKKVFFFEPLHIEQDEIRTETTEDQKKLSHMIKETYLNLGYAPISVPLMSAEERYRFILDVS